VPRHQGRLHYSQRTGQVGAYETPRTEPVSSGHRRTRCAGRPLAAGRRSSGGGTAMRRSPTLHRVQQHQQPTGLANGGAPALALALAPVATSQSRSQSWPAPTSPAHRPNRRCLIRTGRRATASPRQCQRRAERTGKEHRPRQLRCQPAGRHASVRSTSPAVIHCLRVAAPSSVSVTETPAERAALGAGAVQPRQPRTVRHSATYKLSPSACSLIMPKTE
jgi:hypothetical protein